MQVDTCEKCCNGGWAGVKGLQWRRGPVAMVEGLLQSPCTWLGHILWPAGVDNWPYVMGQQGSGQTTGCCHNIWSSLGVGCHHNIGLGQDAGITIVYGLARVCSLTIVYSPAWVWVSP